MEEEEEIEDALSDRSSSRLQRGAMDDADAQVCSNDFDQNLITTI